jgi:hypothetical protein
MGLTGEASFFESTSSHLIGYFFRFRSNYGLDLDLTFNLTKGIIAYRRNLEITYPKQLAVGSRYCRLASLSTCI